MMPALALIAVGPRERWLIPLPLPVILLWPLVALALGGIRLADAVRRGPVSTEGRLARVRAALLAFCRLRGLKLHVRSSGNVRVLVRFL